MKRERVIELWLAGFVLVAGLIVVVVLLGTAAADGPPMSERAPLSFSPIHNLLPTNNVYAFGHIGVVGNIIKRNKVDPLCNEKDGCYPYGDGCEERDYYCMGNETGCNYTSSNRHADGWVDTGNTRWVDVNKCKKKEQKEQEYRDYKCSAGYCNYSINDTKWIDTGICNTTCNYVSLAPPKITSFAPLSYVDDTVCNWRTFNVTINQAVNVSWYLNDTLVLTNESVLEAECTLHAEVVGEHNVTAIASNANGSDMQTWTWAVTSETQTIGTGTKTITQTIQVSNSFPMFSNAEYVYFTIGNDNITLTLDDTASFDGVCNLSDLMGRDVSVAGTTVELTYFPITYQGVSHDQKWVSAPFFDDTEHKLYLLAGSGLITKSRLMIEENSATTPIPKVVGVGSTVGQFQIETVAEGSNSNYNWLESNIQGLGYANIYAQYAPDTSYEKTPFLPTISQCEKLQGSIDSSISGSESKVAYQVDVLGVANGAEPIPVVSHDWNLSLDLDVEYFPITYQGVSHDQKWAVFPFFDDTEHKLYLLSGSGLITKSRLMIEENSATTPIPKVVGVGSTVGQFQIETVAEGINSADNYLFSRIMGLGFADLYVQYAPDTAYEHITFIPTFSQCEQLQLNTNSNGSFIWYDAHVLGLATGVECLKFDGIPLDNVAIDETFDLTYHPVYISGDGFDEKWSAEPEQYEDILVILRGTGTMTELNFIFNDSTAALPKIRSYGYLRGDYTITANILPHYMAVVANGADVAAMDESEQGGFGVQFGEDTTPPTVTSVSPQNGAIDVTIDTVVTATFSEAMDSSTITKDNFTLAGTPRRGWEEVPPVPPTESMISGTVTYDSDTYTATFNPDANLEYNHEYTATLSTAITDKAGNPLAEEYRWKFKTTKIEIGAITKVINTGDSGLRIHKDDPAGETLKVVPDGWTFKIIGGPQYDIQDHNWWRIQEEKYEPSSIEGWVAEDFIRVAAPDDLVPGFPPDYFVSAQDTVEQAIEWAESKEGSSEWEGLCLKFVREAFQGEFIAGWTSAEAARQQLEKEGKFYPQSNCWNPPRGALVFFSALGEYQSLGHVGLYLGNGGVVHSYDKVRVDTTENGVNKGIVIVERLNKIDSYIGWAYPPVEWIKKYNPNLTIPVYTPFSQQAHKGTELTYTINVTNEGDLTDTITLSPSDTQGWDIQLSETSVTLAPGESTRVYLYLTIEKDVVDRITITGTSQGDISKKSSCTVTASSIGDGCGLFAAILSFRNKDAQVHTLNLDVPNYVKISDETITLNPSENKPVNVVFDPKPSESDISIIYIAVTDTTSGESARIPIKFDAYEIIATNFDMAMDSYSFPNGIYKIETCYGMSETSILYFHHTIPLPGNNPNTYSLRRDEAKENIIYHQNSLTNNVLAWRLRFFPWTIDADKEYKKLEANIGNGNPVILCLKDHAVVAYKIVKKGDESYIFIYENENPYEISPNNFYLSFPYATYNSISHEFDFGRYAKFLVQEAEKDIVTVEQALITSPTLTLMINCPVNVTIADQYNRIISDDGTNEIPNASIISTNEPKLFYLPAELTYFVNINAYDAGKFTLTITFPVTSTTVSLNVFSNISTTEKTQATLEIVPNMTNPMKIDYDGDGTIDEEKYPDMTEIIDVNQPPIASFTYSPKNPLVEETITFNASSSYDPDGTITKYEWNFGDGNISGTTEPIITHSYASAGDYTVNLTVSDDDGATSSTSQLINVSEAPLPVLKIEKTSSPNHVQPGGTLTYMIEYYIEGGPVTNVIIVENYPKAVTFISADPAPDAGTNNKWTIGTLSAGASGQIIIKMKVPESRDLAFTESGSVTGEGFVMVSKDISTEQKPYSFKNVVTLSCAELASVSASASTTVSGVPGTSLEITEHGSGIYSSDEILNLQTKNKSIMLQKSTEAEYQPTSFNFSDGFAVNFATRWMQDICARNIIMGDAMHKKIKDASYIKDETIAEVGGYRTSMEFESSFYGAAHIGTVSKSAKTSEDYIGEFEITWAGREECRYLFNWSRVPGNDSEKLIQFLVDVLDLKWAENATITKSVDEMSINITDDGNTATITIDANKKTATVKVGGEIIYVLEVRIEDDTLNIYDCKLEKMDESVSGIGYVMLDKDLASGQIQVREHGSGNYSSDMNFESGRLDKVTEAEYQSTSFNFSDDFAITFPSLWFQSICTKNPGKRTAIHKKISEATSMKDDTTATKSSMEFESSFNGSMHIGARTKGTRISEDYIGVFNITELIKIGKPAISTPSTPTPDWLPCPFPKPSPTPTSGLPCPSSDP